MAKNKGTHRKRYTKQQRADIIAAADKEGLTAAGVEEKFGVNPVTYYAWRKKAKLAERGTVTGGGATDASEARLRKAVRSKLERQFPRIVEEEVDRFLKEMLGRD
jgi:transposase-like protein